MSDLNRLFSLKPGVFSCVYSICCKLFSILITPLCTLMWFCIFSEPLGFWVLLCSFNDESLIWNNEPVRPNWGPNRCGRRRWHWKIKLDYHRCIWYFPGASPSRAATNKAACRFLPWPCAHNNYRYSLSVWIFFGWIVWASDRLLLLFFFFKSGWAPINYLAKSLSLWMYLKGWFGSSEDVVKEQIG